VPIKTNERVEYHVVAERFLPSSKVKPIEPYWRNGSFVVEAHATDFTGGLT